MDWPDADDRPLAGEMGRDAVTLVALHGSTSGLRNDVASAFTLLPGRYYANVDLSSADLSDSWLDKHDLRGANLRQACLRRATLLRADLRWADLRGADLRDVRMAASDLRWSDLRGCDLRYARLDVAQEHDGWRPSNLEGVLLEGTNFKGLLAHSTTVWPPFFDPEERGVVVED